MTFMSKSRWISTRISFVGVNDHNLQIRIAPEHGRIPAEITIDQPVGISMNRGVEVYMFEVPVVGYEAAVNDGKGGILVLKMPENIEKMQRRAFTRVHVPDGMNVKVLCWHRGYIDANSQPPMEHYWQGDLVDLSAGGMQVRVNKDQGLNFKQSQIVGLQFTPMPYQKPIIIEGQVRRVSGGEMGCTMVGVEFLGIESAGEGREKLYRIIDTVSDYEHQNAEAAKEVLVEEVEETSVE